MKILIAEDELLSRRVLEASLAKWGYEVEVAKDGSEAWTFFEQEDEPRLAVLDWMMPGLDGVEVCRRIRHREARPYVYIVLLTARSQKQDLLRALEAGADDYLTKPFDAEELRARLHVGRRIIELQDELIAAREALRFQATHDPLTGLFNRAVILDVLRRELHRGQREHTPVGVVMADLDHFKKVNDTHGHLTGDAVLREAAHRMAASVRGYDAVGRYGGEEFLIVVPTSDEMGTLAQAERIRQSIEGIPIATPAGEMRVTASFGLAVSSDAEPAEPEALVHAADTALYRAKQAGRNRTELATAADFTEALPFDSTEPVHPRTNLT
jgi:two-component system cell cycle response regulator